MILTDKAKTDFLKWYFEKGNKKINFKEFSLDIAKTIQNALIIEWLDSIEYKAERVYSYFFAYYWKHRLPNKTFNDICIQTIERCNEFYNELYKLTT